MNDMCISLKYNHQHHMQFVLLVYVDKRLLLKDLFAKYVFVHLKLQTIEKLLPEKEQQAKVALITTTVTTKQIARLKFCHI